MLVAQEYPLEGLNCRTLLTAAQVRTMNMSSSKGRKAQTQLHGLLCAREGAALKINNEVTLLDDVVE